MNPRPTSHKEGDDTLKKLALLCCLALCAVACAAPTTYHVISRLQIGGEGGWDYPMVDSEAHRLYLSRGTHVVVVDLDTGTVAGDIPDTSGVHGVAVARDLGRGFTSNGRGNNVTVFDLKSFKVLDSVATGRNPDAILYDPASKCVFTFNGGSHDATVIEAATGKVLATIPLGGKPEFPAADGRGRIWVNIEDTGEVAEIDSRALAVTRRFSVKPGESPTGLALDPRRHRLYSVCGNKLMVVLDTRTGEVLATLPIGAGADGAGWDPRSRLAFSSNGDGTLTVVKEVSRGKFEVVQTATTQRGARTIAVDARTHRVYLPTAQFAPPPAGATGRQRPSMVPGSFVVLVVGP